MVQNPISIIDPRLKTLHDYWLRKRGPRLAPTRADMKPNELKFILAQVYLLEVVGLPHRFRFRLAGTALENEYGGQLTGKFADEIDLDGVGNLILREYESVAKEALPVATSWNYTKDDGRKLEYENLILPLSSNGRTVDMLFGAAEMKGVSPLSEA